MKETQRAEAKKMMDEEVEKRTRMKSLPRIWKSTERNRTDL